jgi:hypothetical protein
MVAAAYAEVGVACSVFTCLKRKNLVWLAWHFVNRG